jgi:16S rRNA processing protein RimM
MKDDEERGWAELAAEPRFLVIGRVLRPHGVRGEFVVQVETDLPERFEWLKEIFLDDRLARPFGVESARFHHGSVILKLAGIDDREHAMALRGRSLMIPESEGLPLAEGEYYLYQAIGLAVTTDDGVPLGEIAQILETGANNVFVVKGPRGEILLPDTDDVVLEIDFAARNMTVHLLPGLLG